MTAPRCTQRLFDSPEGPFYGSCNAAQSSRAKGRSGPVAIMIQRGNGIATSTPPQPAYVVLARSATVKTGQCQALPEWKAREIKSLARKRLIFISYWNR